MEIDYSKYLDGDEWPSESLAATVDEATGEYAPALEPVFDMVPQKAVAALHKLIRWARSMQITVEGEEQAEAQVRQSNLGRLLARKALRIEDFELYSEHGVDRSPMSNMDVAKAVAIALMGDPRKKDSGVFERIDASTAAALATGLAQELSNEGYTIYKES